MTMPQGSWPLNTTGNVTLDASGNGTVQLRPDGPQEHWALSLASFKTAQTVITNEAQCRIYIGPQVADQYFVDGTLSGSTGDSTGKVANGYDISRAGPLSSVWAVWTGGDPGALATLSISGTASFGQGGGTPFSAGQGCSNPIVGGGGALVYPSIHSPNFDVANPVASPSPSWGILKSGLAYFFGLILSGGTIQGTDYIINSSGAFFYSSTPASGNLIASIAHTSGTDSFGNSYVAGFGTYDNTFGNTGQLNAASLAMFAGVNHTVSLSPSGLTIFNSHGATIFALDETRDAFFLYADTGSASQGALIQSVTNNNGTDSFGNAYLTGNAVYWTTGGNFYALVLTRSVASPPPGLAVASAASAAGPYVFASTSATVTAGGIAIMTTASLILQSSVTLTPLLNTMAPTGGDETWHSLAGLYQAGFTDGTPASFYRLEAQGVTSGTVRLKGTFVLTANEASGTTILTLPAGYRPAQAMAFAAPNNLSGFAAGSSSVGISTAGVITLGVAGSNTNFVRLDGITFSTD